MKFIEDNFTETLIMVGFVLVSFGLFLISAIVGCIGTGIMFLGLAYLTIKIGGG